MHTRLGGTRAMSLLEVLIIISILAVLVALFTPATRRAKQSAESVKCAQMLRSWGVSFQLYAAENNGYYPFSWINNSDNWTLWISPYVQSNWLTYDPVTMAKRLDPKKAGCPTYAKLKTDVVDSQFRPFPYAYNAARFDYPFGNDKAHIRGTTEQPGGWDPVPGWVVPAGSWGSWYVAIRYNGSSVAGGAGQIDKYFNIPPTVLYTEPAECVTMFCGVASVWRYYSVPFNATVTGGPDGNDWDIRSGSCIWVGDISRWYDDNGMPYTGYNAAPLGVHNRGGGNGNFVWQGFTSQDGQWVGGAYLLEGDPDATDNYLFMDGHVESRKVSDPLLSRLVYNQIPNTNNPYRD